MNRYSKFEALNRILYGFFCIIIILILWLPVWILEKILKLGCILLGYNPRETKIMKIFSENLDNFLKWLTDPIL